MTDRDPTASEQGTTSELEPAEPGSARTEPINPGEPVAPPPPGGYASLGRSGAGIPGGLIVVALVILLVGALVGFLIGRSGSDEVAPVRERVEQDGGGGGGGGQGEGRAARRERRQACRQAFDLSGQLIELQRQALANQVALTEAVIAEDAERIGTLTAAGEALQAQTAQIEGQLGEATARCRPS
jgi:hypothetical protein